ncbi:probable 39S ribosomal protein L49, mitochondrial [Daktulosphaira vitifoliae]|uniref:probable 39S ribosomal protein L49, mitochondrial n=1 Tax=Daktulosphaira vitifoliae TaxID=58002 RepID=UPI0021A9B345|nr:probable 39S ribosomal protein L49, mitochondrial [Daktulosphaira vitifoliae]
MALRVLLGNNYIKYNVPSILLHKLLNKRDSSYRSSPIAQDPSHYAKFKVTSDPKEWQYVERLLPPTIIPPPPQTKNLPSGWKPQTAKFGQYPYFVHRTRNHMLPVYLKISMRGTRRITQINNIDGNIWALEETLKKYLEKLYGSKQIIATKVHEVCGQLCFHGDHVTKINDWLHKKGL